MSPPIDGVAACLFDAYRTLFDVASAAGRLRGPLGDRWQPLAELWRAKQLQYSWLRGLMGRHADFWQVTQDALDFAMESLGLQDPALRARLMSLYERLGAYPEARPALEALRRAGLRLAILSNGAPRMLAAAGEAAGLNALLDAVLSVESVGIYKPSPSGMTIDDKGNVYLTGKGVMVFDPSGSQVEQIDVPDGWTANVCFGGTDRHALFITASKSLYSLKMQVKGVGSQ